MKIFIYFIMFLFLFCVGLLLMYTIIKQKLYDFKKHLILMKNDIIVTTLKENIIDINNMLIYNYNLCTLSFFFVDVTYHELFFNIIGIPIKNDITKLYFKKDLEFFCYKIINTKEKDIFLLTLLKENACFTLNTTYGTHCEFIRLNNYKFENLFKNLFKDNIEEIFDKSDVVYLPIKLEKIIIKREKITNKKIF